MKKIILLLIFSTLAFILNAEPLYLKATAIQTKLLPNGEWSSWEQVDIFVIVDTEVKAVQILSKEIQEFNFVSFVSKSFDGGKIYISPATDSKGRNVYLTFCLYDSGFSYIQIEYKDFEYKYKLEVY